MSREEADLEQEILEDAAQPRTRGKGDAQNYRLQNRPESLEDIDKALNTDPQIDEREKEFIKNDDEEGWNSYYNAYAKDLLNNSYPGTRAKKYLAVKNPKARANRIYQDLIAAPNNREGDLQRFMILAPLDMYDYYETPHNGRAGIPRVLTDAVLDELDVLLENHPGLLLSGS